MRLIDADALERVIMMLPDEELCDDCCYNVIAKLDDAPTVELPKEHELVRCKDCKHHHHNQNQMPYCDKHSYGWGWKDDDFCSYAERR